MGYSLLSGLDYGIDKVSQSRNSNGYAYQLNKKEDKKTIAIYKYYTGLCIVYKDVNHKSAR